jgi:hypothetical protein
LVINFSKLNFRKRPNFIIRNFDGKAIGVLGHIIKPEAIIRYRDFSEISFTYPSHVNGKKLSEYDLLTGMRIIDVEGFGQFILHNPAENDNGVKSSKSCSGYSLEYEFTNKSISLEEGTYNFWNPFAPDSTILGIILSEMPSWSLGTVSSSLIGKYRTFSVDGLSIYDFMKSELEKTYECVFDFDTYNRKINVRNKYDTVPTKPVYISTSNLAKEIVVEEDIDDLFTVLDVNGADGVDIRSVNPMGENRIYNLDSYMTEEYFSADIIQKWNRWKITFESYQTLYYSIVIAQNMQISRYATESAVLTDMQGELTGLESQKAALLQAVAMDSSLQSKLNTVNSQIKFKESEINSQNSLLTTIQNQISNYTSQLKQINKETAFSSFFTDNELKILDRYFKCGSLTDSSFVASEVDSYSSESSVTRGLSSVFNIANCTAVRMATYTSDITFYTIRGGFINVNDSQLKLNADVVSGTLQVNRDNTFVMSLYLNQGSINGNTFPSGTLSLTGRLYTNVSYGDTSIRINTSATTAYMTYETSEYQRMSIAWDLFEYGKDVLDKKAYPVYHFTVDSSNFFAIDDFVSFAKEFTLGERIYLHLNMGVIEPIVTGVSVEFDDLSKLELEFASDFQIKNGKFSFLDNLDESVSISKTLDFNQFNYSNFVNSGANTNIKKFMDSALDTMKNMILSGTHNEITIDQAGLRCRKYDEASGGYSPKQIWMAHNALMFTNDGWNSATIGIGEFVDKNLGSLYGIVTPALVGTILAGNNLIIESEKTDGGVAVFKMDGEGASLHNASFNLYGSTGGRIDLGAVFGIVGGGDKNTMFYYNSKGQPTGVRTANNRSVTRIANLASNDTPNANFWIDMYGDVYLKGTIDAVAGIFRGSLEVGGPTAFRVDSQGNLSIGGTATNPNFYVDANGNMRAKSADIKGRVDASSLYIGGRNILTNTSGSNNLATSSSKIDSDYLDLYGITIRNKSTNAVTFQVTDNGAVTINGNITMGAGSSINWATVDEINPTMSQAYQRANGAYNYADDAWRYAGDAYTRANGAYNLAYDALDDADAAYRYANDAYNFAWDNRCNDLNVFNVLTSGGTRFGIFSDSYGGRLYINANYIRSGTIDADIVTLGTRTGGFCCAQGSDGIRVTNGAKMYGSAGPYADYYVFVSNAGALMSGGSAQFYCAGSSIHANREITVDSDRRFKNNILYNIDRYEDFFLKLNPASFLLNKQEDKKRHIGFIAQDVEAVRNECGLSEDELALLETFEREDENSELQIYYGIRYGEIIPVCVHMIQKLFKEIERLKCQIKEDD